MYFLHIYAIYVYNHKILVRQALIRVGLEYLFPHMWFPGRAFALVHLTDSQHNPLTQCENVSDAPSLNDASLGMLSHLYSRLT